MRFTLRANAKAAMAASLHRWRFAVLALIFTGAVSLQFVFEHSELLTDTLRLPEGLQHGVERISSFFSSPFSYMPRPVEARYVALVSISDESEGPMQGPCAVRSFLASLLPSIVAAQPTMIVSDIALAGDDTSDTCPSTAPETQNLVHAIQLAAENTPLAIGQASWTKDEVSDAQAHRFLTQGFGNNDLLLRKTINLGARTKNISFGLIRLNQNLDKVPIVWLSHSSEDTGAYPVPSLALTAAEMYRSTFPNGGARLQRLQDDRYHPVTELLPESAFAVVPAIKLMCPLVGNGIWPRCAGSSEPSTEISDKLRGRIVILGFSNRAEDLWKTSVGRVPGYALHASYIEGLLDARTYRPLGFWMTCLLSGIWLLLVELPFWLLELPMIKSLIFSAGISIIVLFLARYVALVNFGLYVSLFAPSVLLVAVSVLHVLAKKIEEERV